MEFYGYHPFYTDVVRDLWTAGSQALPGRWRSADPRMLRPACGLRQRAMVALRRCRSQFGIFIVPIPSALGLADMCIARSSVQPPGNNGWDFRARTSSAIAARRDRAVNIYLGLVALHSSRAACAGLRATARCGCRHDVSCAYDPRPARLERARKPSRANNLGYPSLRGRARCSTCRVRVTEGLENCPPATGDEAKTP